jgi:hypothetical protein
MIAAQRTKESIHVQAQKSFARFQGLFGKALRLPAGSFRREKRVNTAHIGFFARGRFFHHDFIF